MKIPSSATVRFAAICRLGAGMHVGAAALAAGAMLVGAAVVSAGCVPAPKQDYTPQQIEKIDSLEEVMRVQAKHMDPLFSIQEKTKFTDAEYLSMESSGATIRETGRSIRERFSGPYPEAFVNIATEMSVYGEELAKAGREKNATAAQESIAEIRQRCQQCHNDHR